ncbi:MAG TPA: hypothetical protein VJ417_08405 [Candidatus Glassbacteria bacterium]|nr:hypothetical protein [Candidatus Glassbacteria bacterium]
MKAALAQALKPFGEWVFGIIQSVPLPLVRYIFLGLLAVLAVWVLTLPAQRAVDESGKAKSFITDLRLFAVFLLACQSICYIIF